MTSLSVCDDIYTLNGVEWYFDKEKALEEQKSEDWYFVTLYYRYNITIHKAFKTFADANTGIGNELNYKYKIPDNIEKKEPSLISYTSIVGIYITEI